MSSTLRRRPDPIGPAHVNATYAPTSAEPAGGSETPSPHTRRTCHRGPVVTAAGVRIGWSDVPEHVQLEIARIVGVPIVKTESQVGGFSPGAAERLVGTDGRRAFVKAANSSLNEFTPDIYRRQIAITAGLPLTAPATTLLGSFDDGDWVALVLADVEGRHPVTPWEPGEVAAVLETLQRLADELTPVPDGLVVPRTEDELRDDFAGFDNFVTAPWDELPQIAVDHLDELRALAIRGVDACHGESLVHLDVRADNMLVRPDGSVVLVDWPWAGRGAAWIDSIALLVNVGLYGGHDIEALMATSPMLRAADSETVTAFLAGLAAYFLDSARQLAPVGLPTVRAFQLAQGQVVLGWLTRRLGWAAEAPAR